MKPLLSAIAFLTRLPVPAWVHDDQLALQRSAAWFPVVGLLLGSLYGGTAFLLQHRLPATVIAALLLTEDGLLTGALHLDGLADMADGFGGGRTSEDVLRIMRDHVIGAYGAVALILATLLKFACLKELAAKPAFLPILICAPALSRWSVVLLSVTQPYARATMGGSGALAVSVKPWHLAVATITCLPALLIGGWNILFGWLAVTLVSLFIARWSRRRIGGITGDVLGANVVVCEATQFLLALLW